MLQTRRGARQPILHKAHFMSVKSFVIATSGVHLQTQLYKINMQYQELYWTSVPHVEPVSMGLERTVNVKEKYVEVSIYLAKGAKVKSIWLGISRACIHVISQQKHQFQQAAKSAALSDLFTCCIYCQDIWSQVVYMLLKLESEKDVAKARSESLHAAHLWQENACININRKWMWKIWRKPGKKQKPLRKTYSDFKISTITFLPLSTFSRSNLTHIYATCIQESVARRW